MPDAQDKADSNSARRNLAVGALAALAAALIGSGWQLASRHGVTTSLGPVELAVLRYGIPALLLSPIYGGTLLRLRGQSAGLPVLLAVGGGLPFGLLVLAGAQYAPASHMGVFMAGCVPLFTAIGAWLAFGDRVGGLRLVGLCLVACGVASFGVMAFGLTPGAWRGDALFLLAAVLWAVYSLAFRRSGLSPWQAAAWVNGVSAVLLMPIVLLWGAPRLLSAPWPDVAWQGLGQGVVAGLLGLVTYMVAIARLGAARASLSAALVPALTALGAALLLGEPLTGSAGVALALVMPGIAMAAAQQKHGASSPGAALR